MNSHVVVDLFRQAFMAAFWLSLPILVVGFVAGILISLLQILTSIQDPAFGSVPRLAVYFVGLLLLLPWMLSSITTYTVRLLGDFAPYVK
jgi:flagellar biosynthetic protein FliQ